MREIPNSQQTYQITADKNSTISSINIKHIAQAAKLAGAPNNKAAGIDLHVKLDEKIAKGQPLLTIHASANGEIEYVNEYIKRNPIFKLGIN